MTSQRFFLRWLQALAALLVLAVAPANGHVAAHSGALIGTIEAPAKTGSIGKHAHTDRRDAAAFASYLEVDDEKDQHARSAPRVRLGASWRAAPVSLVAHYQAAPATHRSCAAPPTGPPHS